MRPFSLLCLVAVLALFVDTRGVDASIVVAGSSSTAPPAFQAGPYFQITPVIDRAFTFTIDSSGPYRVNQLQVAAYRFASRDGVSAQFAIHADADGLPGPSLTTFNIEGVPLDVPSVLTANPNLPLLLEPNSAYWIVGSAVQGQVNWNLAQGIFPMISVPGTYAYQLHNDPWVVVPDAQLATFAILGTPVPEPGPLALGTIAAIGSCAIVRRRIRRYTRRGNHQV